MVKLTREVNGGVMLTTTQSSNEETSLKGQRFLYVGLPDGYESNIQNTIESIYHNGGVLDVVDADSSKIQLYADWVDRTLTVPDEVNFHTQPIQEFLDNSGTVYVNITLDSIFNKWRYEKETQYEFFFKIIEACMARCNTLSIYINASGQEESYNMIYLLTVLLSTYEHFTFEREGDKYNFLITNT